ncbi:uncharacterized protein A4U43_C10F5000 [Asparagus officinalis]|uniref:Uncharacterized protein n=1 Tax=Asparagus officinalis TaxID=4686 RepID=A0A5P1E0T8_ASPOF|nr:uncharacterized protein A4U43_C10F5000 [Asparagus officinalis]
MTRMFAHLQKEQVDLSEAKLKYEIINLKNTSPEGTGLVSVYEGKIQQSEDPYQGKWPIWLVDDGNIGTAKRFEYMYYLDFEASMAEKRAQNALAEIQEFTSFLRVLGSYPMDMIPWNTTEELGLKVRTKE